MPAPKPRMHGLDHAHGGPDPIGIAWEDIGTADLHDLILSLDPTGFWPLDETSGLVANDVSGNSHHLTSVRSAVVWGQPAGPPGTLTPSINRDRLAKNTADATHIELLNTVDNFSAVVWVFANNRAELPAFMGFGTPSHSPYGAGWEIMQHNTTYKFQMQWGGGVGIDSNSALPDNTWYLFGLSRDAGTMKLYVNGAQQALTSTAAPTAPATFWLGSDDYNHPSGSYAITGRLSYAAYWGTRVLTAAEHSSIYETGVA